MKISNQLMKIVKNNFRGSEDESYIAQRAKLAKKIASVQKDRTVALYIWSRDCDGMESDSMRVVPASVTYIENRMSNEYFNAEGPVSFRILPPTEIETFRSNRRDAVLEAFEDGHAHSITGGCPQY